MNLEEERDALRAENAGLLQEIAHLRNALNGIQEIVDGTSDGEDEDW